MSDRHPDDPPDPLPSIESAARHVAAGEPVDWPGLESSAPDAMSRGLLERLHAVEQIAAFHRELQHPAPPLETWGPLTILEEIGRGSFGKVYRAKDPKLDRDVALKILDPGRSPDSPHGRDLIEEGRLLARVRHPNVVTIYRADRVDDRVGLEMELISGRTLAAIVREQGPLSADEAALVGRDVCRALAAVHHAGLIHRDVKAQNVMREQGGRIVLMDFGAGRTSSPGFGGGRAFRASGESMVTGTPHYLAPEIIAGEKPSVRSDLYSLGVLLFFLVTGSFPADARTLEELRAAHRAGTLRRLRDVRPDLPESFIRLVDHATAVDPKDRPDGAGQLESELSRAMGRHSIGTRQPSRPRAGTLVAIATGLAAIVIASIAIARQQPLPAPLVAQFVESFDGHLTIPHGPGSREFAISPDGSSIVYATMRSPRRESNLFVRRIGDPVPRKISDIGGQPFFSPDGSRVGAYGTNLITVSLAGGDLVTVADVKAAGGGSWATDGTIVYSSAGDLWRVAEGGGTPTRLTNVAAGGQAAIRPHVLPTGDILFTLRDASTLSYGAAVLTRAGDIRPLVENATGVKYMPPGYLIFVSGNPTWITAAPFDLDRLKLTGPPVQIQAVKSRSHWFDVSASGSMAFSSPEDPAPGEGPQLVWIDRATMRETPLSLPLPPGEFLAYSLRLSPDNQKVAFTTAASSLMEFSDLADPGLLAIADLARGTISPPLSREPAHPLAWTPDSRQITYRTSSGAIAIKPADGSGQEQILASAPAGRSCNTGDWSPDGLVLLLGCGATTGAAAHSELVSLTFPSLSDIGRAPVTPKSFMKDKPGQGAPRFSPDGRWVAYSSNIGNGRGARTFVRPFPEAGPVHSISKGIGRFPIWRGRELFFVSLEPESASMTLTPQFSFKPARPVFPKFEGYDILNDGRFTFDVSADGQRLLLLKHGNFKGGDYLTTLTVTLNWVEEVKRKLAGR